MYGLTDGPTQIIEIFSFEKYNLAIIDDIKLTCGTTTKKYKPRQKMKVFRITP